MRRLLPDPPVDLDPASLPTMVAAEARPSPDRRPWVALNMVASIDGAITVEGRSGGLGGPSDLAMFRALRELPDVILAGAGTVRTEDYGPVVVSEEGRARRRARGQSERPRLVVVSASMRLDPAARLFSDPSHRPIVLTCERAPSDARRHVAEVADVLVVGDDDVDLPAAMEQLSSIGAEIVLCEGGPTLNARLLADDLVDEWCQTIAPVAATGSELRGSAGAPPGVVRAFRLARLLTDDDGVLLARYVRAS
jgi:riboflavin-specific deaminase-like protein